MGSSNNILGRISSNDLGKSVFGEIKIMDWLYVLTGIAIMLATMTTIWFTVKRQDRMFDRFYRDDSDDEGGIQV